VVVGGRWDIIVVEVISAVLFHLHLILVSMVLGDIIMIAMCQLLAHFHCEYSSSFSTTTKYPLDPDFAKFSGAFMLWFFFPLYFAGESPSHASLVLC